MKFLKFVFLPLFSLLLYGCSQAGFAVVNAPASFDGNSEIKDIGFGNHNQKLDIYVPKNTAQTGAHPVLIFIYGGRWTDGYKSQYRFIGSKFSSNGYITVIPDYRKYPQVKFPDFVEDNAQAVAWVEKNIAQYGGNPNQIYLMGHSAGALNAALLSADERYLKNAGADISNIKAFAGLAGPYSFTPDEPDLMDMFGPPENYPNMQVTSFIEGNEPPMLLLHGGKDTTVYLSNLQKLEKEIGEKGGAVKTNIYPELDHTGIIKVFTWVYKDSANVEGDILNWFENHKN